MVKMQYRAGLTLRQMRREEWLDLPDELAFSDFYLPRYFEFRAAPADGESLFLFDERITRA